MECTHRLYNQTYGSDFSVILQSGTWGLPFEALDIIYNQLFIPTITYACSSWGWASHKVHAKRKLNSAQRKALILLTKAYKTAPTSAFQVIARKPPIEMHIDYFSQISHFKWGEDVQINTGTITASDLERPTPLSLLPNPCELPIQITDTDQENDIVIFTDGSKNERNVGCAFVVYSNNIEIAYQMFRLGELSTVFQAEMFAILQALIWANQHYSFTRITICSDSASSLATIKSTKAHPLSTAIKKSVLNSNNDYKFKWVMAHRGTSGNERADHLAKHAANNDQLIISYNKISLNTIKGILWSNMLNNWQQKWNSNEGKITYKFFPIIKDIFKYTWMKPCFWSTQFFTDHGKFAKYLHRFTEYINKECPTCKIEDGSTHYNYIFNCEFAKKSSNIEIARARTVHDAK
ncbi:uncharacterized protein LOC111617710 [Centruroides sculpturatus]|uniref:uncharacterized protein LOC111617710 n=1 Tax=Centruroides sculpturatus TaxID=218467 RepID=UPI000C6DDF57|nr:uncharacterized protein LOC111617710 [Centruroides sculpturatus]